MKIVVKTTVNAPMADVWRAYTTPEDIIRWNAASDVCKRTISSNVSAGATMQKYTGNCHCGAVQYEIEAEKI